MRFDKVPIHSNEIYTVNGCALVNLSVNFPPCVIPNEPAR